MNKSILITGCSKGIGKAIAAYFLEKKWNVFGVDVTPCELPLKKFFQKDISKMETFAGIGQELSKDGVRLSCVVNNAAILIAKPLIETTEKEWNSTLHTNLSSIFYCVKALHPLMIGGSVVNISSVHARATSIGLCAYVASKGALSALTRALALELAEHGVRVNAILPGAIESEMLQQGLARSQSPEKSLEKLINIIPLKLIGEGRDIAKLTYFLADKELSGYITGQEFVCDGGALARLASE